MRNKIIYIGCGLLLLLSGACSDELDLAPVSSISDANFWQSPGQADAFVNGIHSRLRSHTYALILLGEMRADIFGTDPGASATFTGEATQGIERMWLNTLDADAAGVGNFGGFYNNINQLNLLINKMNETSELREADRTYYLGIAHGMRAFYYFHLLRSWGGVIIRTEPTITIDIADLARPANSPEEVMQLIREDIDQSVANFGDNYTIRNNKGFWSRAATLMLKAEVYLWTSYRGGGTADATVARDALLDIQSHGSFSLLPDFTDVFSVNNRGNDEVIFAIRYGLDEANLPIANTFMPQTGLIVNFYDSLDNRPFTVQEDNYGGLLRAPVEIAAFREFDDLDTRKRATIQGAYTREGGVYEIAGAFIKKYPGEQNAGNRFYTNDFPVYRYADLLLLLAEAKVILGEDPSAEINAVRERAYGENYQPAMHGFPNQPIDVDPKEAILQERYFEFMFEGKRWYDLRRMGDEYVYRFTSVEPSEEYKLLWPVDRNTLTNNRALKQNPGYPSF